MGKYYSFLGKIMTSIIIATTLVSCSTRKMLENEGELLEYIDIDRAYSHIEYLSNEIGGRVSGTTEENDAAKYIEKQFKEMGYKVKITKFKINSGISINIEATKSPSGKDKNDTDKIVYVTAHYDTVEGSQGANDNASGVASIMEIANSIKDLDVDCEVRFIAFGSEEFGLRGSSNYIYKLSDNEINRSIACFNLDMVATAYTGFDELRAYTVNGNNNIVTDALYQARKTLDIHKSDVNIELYKDSSKGRIEELSRSDHVNFEEIGIPSAIFINVNPVTEKVTEPWMHTKSDVIENISIEKLERSIKLIGKAIYDTINQ